MIQFVYILRLNDMILTCTHEPSETEREEKRLGDWVKKENKNF